VSDVRTLGTAAGAGVEGGGVAVDRQRPEQKGVEDLRRGPARFADRPQRPDEEQVLLDGRLPLLGDQPFRGLEHDRPGGVRAVVGAHPGGVGAQGLRLRDDVEGAGLGELQVDVAERLEPGAEARGGPAYTLRHRPDPTVLPRQERDDAVGLSQLLGAQHDAFVAVVGHRIILPVRRDSGAHLGWPDRRRAGNKAL
jgi:hypothetical protein